MPLSAVVLAAGKGTRMKSSLPKVLHPIANKPMVQHILDALSEVGAEQINLVYGHGADQLQSALAHNQINWCLQAEQLGTGHAVMQAVPNISDNDDVLILVGDVPLIQVSTLNRLIEVKQQCDLALLTVELDDPTGLGRIIRDGDNITAIIEHKDATDEQREIKEINTGIMLMSGIDLKRWLGQLGNDNAQQEYYLTDVIGMASEEGKRIQAAHPDTPIEVEGVNNRLQLARLECEYQHRKADELMLSGVTVKDPYRIDVRGTLETGTDVEIDVNCIFEGTVKLGNNVTIGANCILKDCVVGDNTRIEPFSMLEDAEVADACTIGPYARLRPGSKMLDGAKVGNFVEMKKTTLGKGAKANHLTYLGDANIGENTNIGAGTITCNYDGVNKFKTEIGSNVFVGSNTAIVAPAKLGDGSTIGAGSVVTKEVDTDELAIARAKQRNIKGWTRPTKLS